MSRGSYHARFSSALLAVAAAVAGGCAWLGLPHLLSYLVAINVTTLGAYAYDKAIAGREGLVRVPESVLHLLALLGGSPAGLVAQQTLRHKTAKASFQRVFWAIFVVQVAAIAWWAFGGKAAGVQEGARAAVSGRSAWVQAGPVGSLIHPSTLPLFDGSR